ncbi:MAG TPA: universal stress protein [Desulfobacterales bacterium]|nr:universal stress protein [Desulfobacterales bacterium]
MKTLICIDGHDHALKAARLAGKLAWARNTEATFLFVRRYRKDTRGYNIRRKTTEIFTNWTEELPEMAYLHEAEEVFKKARGSQEDEMEREEPHRALVHVGKGVFEEGRIQLRSAGSAHLKIREGVPHEEIVREAEEGHYDLVMLGAHLGAGCRWYEIENIPLTVAQKAPCPVTIIGKEFEEGQPVLVCVGKKPPLESTLHLGQVIATNMKSEIEVLTVLKSADPDFQFSQEVSSMIGEWSERPLKVTPKVLPGDPVRVILEIAPNYGLIVCSYSEKRKRNRLGKVTKKVLCRQFNILVSR